MTNDVLERMRRDSTPDNMIPTTVRIPIALEAEIRKFCEQNKIKLSIAVRECIERGWRQLGRDISTGRDATDSEGKD